MIYSGFERSQFDNCVYFKKKLGTSNVYFLLYVNDMLLASCDKVVIKDLKKQLKGKFEITDLGLAQRMLGMEISRD